LLGLTAIASKRSASTLGIAAEGSLQRPHGPQINIACAGDAQEAQIEFVEVE